MPKLELSESRFAECQNIRVRDFVERAGLADWLSSGRIGGTWKIGILQMG